MKRTTVRDRKTVEPPVVWQRAEHAALRAIAADTCDDRVSEEIFDFDDEHAEIDLIVHRMHHWMH